MTKLDDRIVDLERENAELRRRLDEALAQHAATTEVLQVINASSGELAPVFDAIIARAMRFCEAAFGILLRYDGENFHAAAHHGLPPEFARFINGRGMDGWRGAHLSLIDGAPFVHILDLAADRATYEKVETRRALVDLGGARSLILVPLQLDAKLLGSLAIYRQEVRPFSNRQIALLGEFADQAVIAIENARLITETRESLERQTATSEILGAVAGAPGDAEGTLHKIAETTARLFAASGVGFRIAEGGEFKLAIGVGRGAAAVQSALYRGGAPRVNVCSRALPSTVIRENRQIHLPDLDNLPPDVRDWPGPPILRGAGVRTLASTPLRREGKAFGALNVYRDELRAFTADELSLMQSFADQASIAIENARLITETREALEQQTATAEVLGIINASPGHLMPVFEAMVDKARRLCDADSGHLALPVGNDFRTAAVSAMSPEMEATIRAVSYAPGRGTAVGRALLERRAVQIADIGADPEHAARHAADQGHIRTILGVPLLREGVPIGAFGLSRTRVEPFAERQIDLVRTFAAQAVIAMENARLLNETRERTRDLQESLEYQTATSDVLKVISQSTFDLQPVLDTLVTTAARLCTADHAVIWRRETDGAYALVANFGFPPEYEAFQRNRGPLAPALLEAAPTTLARAIRERRAIHIEDIAAVPGYPENSITLGQQRTSLGVPLLREGEPIGVLALARRRVEPFSDRQIELVRTFADQAVIAIENARLITETHESLERQTATSEILRAIAAAPGDADGTLRKIAETTMRLFKAAGASFRIADGDAYSSAIIVGRGAEDVSASLSDPDHLVRPRTLPGTVIHEDRQIHLPDLDNLEPEFADWPGPPVFRALGMRTLIGTPLRREGRAFGALVVYRDELRPFAQEELQLLQSFADQAVIAMENARLINETREALEQQTATAEVLQVINSSPGDLAPVFDAMLDKAMRLCGVAFGSLQTYDGELFRSVAERGLPQAFVERLRRGYRAGPTHFASRLIGGEPFVQAPDLAVSDTAQGAFEIGGMRTLLSVPLLREGTIVGIVNLARDRVDPFTDKQIALVQNFAAQAVIAMENARLLTETREALDQQTATAEVLQVINSSPGHLKPVFEAILDKAHALCDAERGTLFLYHGGKFKAAVTHGYPEDVAEHLRAGIDATIPRYAPLFAGNRVHVPDLSQVDTPTGRIVSQRGGVRTNLLVPLLRDGVVLGMISCNRTEVRLFSDKEVALIENFAAQAVIAMENARLLGELRSRTDDLTEALEYQTATSDVLKVISRSTFDLQPVLDTVVETAARLCEADGSGMTIRDGETYRYVAVTSSIHDDFYAALRSRGFAPGRDTIAGRVALEGKIVHIADIAADREYAFREAVTVADIHTLLGVPLLRDGAVVGTLSLTRQRIKPFTERQIELVQTFADQAVIAIENARLLTETSSARDAAETALTDLKAAQGRLIQAEKMASLGQLTAGIAHEIKNPLNFVNNFAALSVELLDELKETTAPALAALDADRREEVDETIGLLTGNLEKITEHGKRADNIVKSMLEHSRGVTGERRAVDLNGLVEEALNLAYHGARAQDPSFNITLERDFDEGLGPIELVPQDMTRVFLNLFGNGFYAANQRARANGANGFRPVLHVATREAGGAVEVRVRDNGSGIPAAIRDKLFQPFFTTKPTGEGTGLGLSISYDIVTQQHGGTIAVASEEGAFTEFTIRLPRQAAKNGAVA